MGSTGPDLLPTESWSPWSQSGGDRLRRVAVCTEGQREVKTKTSQQFLKTAREPHGCTIFRSFLRSAPHVRTETRKSTQAPLTLASPPRGPHGSVSPSRGGGSDPVSAGDASAHLCGERGSRGSRGRLQQKSWVRIGRYEKSNEALRASPSEGPSELVGSLSPCPLPCEHVQTLQTPCPTLPPITQRPSFSLLPSPDLRGSREVRVCARVPFPRWPQGSRGAQPSNSAQVRLGSNWKPARCWWEWERSQRLGEIGSRYLLQLTLLPLLGNSSPTKTWTCFHKETCISISMATVFQGPANWKYRSSPQTEWRRCRIYTWEQHTAMKASSPPAPEVSDAPTS